jgi:hypothetical protein
MSVTRLVSPRRRTVRATRGVDGARDSSRLCARRTAAELETWYIPD